MSALAKEDEPIEDHLVDEEEEVADDVGDELEEDGAVTGDDADAEDSDTDSLSTNSPYADVFMLFTRPAYTAGQQLDLPGGKPVEFLIGFRNKGPGPFVVQTVEASFRYPMDFNYHIQNFSAVPYNREVKPGVEATVAYSFLPSDQFAGRPFGLNVALNYRDSNGVQYNEAVFNETVMISEVDEGFDGETFFLYVLLAGIVVLLLVIGQQYLLGSSGKRKRAAAKKTIETGTTNDSTIDYEWLPEETLRALRKFSCFFCFYFSANEYYWWFNECFVAVSLEKSSPKNKLPKTSPKVAKQQTSSPKQKKTLKQK